MTPLPMAFSQMKVPNEFIAKYMANEIMRPITALMDYQIWLFLQWHYLPFRIPSLMGETDKWVSAVTLNGIRSSNLCKPN